MSSYLKTDWLLHVYTMYVIWYVNLSMTKTDEAAHLAGAVEYTDCFSVEE